MKTRVLLTGLFAAATAFGQYTYDYSENPVIADSTRWSTNGSPSFTSAGVTFSSAGGSLISIPAISGANSSDYEVNTTLALKSGGGTYIHFFRTSSGTVQSGSGSYISAEIVIPSGFTSPGTATLNINQCTSGTVTLLASASVTATDGMTFRSVIFGGNLWVFFNNNWALTSTLPATTGNPGIGGHDMPSGSGFSSVKLGHHDTVAPSQVPAHPFSSSVFPTSASLKWEGVVDDTNGVGLFQYIIVRSGAPTGLSSTAEFTDATLLPSTAYTYAILAQDYHGNLSAPTTVTVNTPPAQAVDPRRVGVRPTGSYWGGGGEQIDTLSGNLNFMLPLVKPQTRTGQTIPVNLVYNSQNWRQDNGVNWELATDVGFGFGWKLLIGSITPYYSESWSGVDHYVYTDGTGAEYLLTVNNSGVWSSQQSNYVWFDSNADKLHFGDGSFWVMGSVSGGDEQDAGTMYPTVLEDVNGNQVLMNYYPGAGLASTATNTSARIAFIDDPRARAAAYPWPAGWGQNSSVDNAYPGCAPYCSARVTYGFFYNADSPVPHLTGIENWIGTAEFFELTYNESVSLGPPFGTDAAYSGLATTQLASVNPESLSSSAAYQFVYDSAGASELQQVTFPFGGHLRWSYATDAYNGSRALRAVSGRYLAADSAGATEWSYGISRDNASAATVHGTMTLTDASGVGAKTWNFVTSGSAPAWELGLASEFVQSASAGGTVLQDDTYTWSQDPAGNPYISAKSSVIGPGGPNQQTALTTQTLDQYGNVTQSVIYPYNNTSTPLRTYNSTYLNSSLYVANYIVNKLQTTTLTMGGTTQTILINSVDGLTGNAGNPLWKSCGAAYGGSQAPTTEVDANPPVPWGSRGLTYSSSTPLKTTCWNYYTFGATSGTGTSEGATASFSADEATNYSAPMSIATQSYSQSVAYNSWLGVTQTTGANGEQLFMTYDGYGRPATGTSAYGATTHYTYGTSAPFMQQASGPNGVTTTTLDGLGRAILVATGDTSGVHSYTATVYAPCACSPLGKVQQVSQPYVPGGTPVWTTYAYDGMGRTLTVRQPDAASTTTYAYSGNQTTVTDPAGNWKQFTSDVDGNLTSVVEPDPSSNSGGTLTTSYTYDWMKHVTQVSMPRAGTTQTRTFVYDSNWRLSSATNPENGTVSYYYNTDNTLQYKQDAKGQQAVYTYDTEKRVTMVQQYPSGGSGSGGTEDTCQRVTYTYDNPVSSGFSLNSTGRLTTKQYGGCFYFDWTTYAEVYQPAFTEMYSYHPAGGVTAKQVQITQQWFDSSIGNWQSAAGDLEVDYTYNNAGQMASVSYPEVGPPYNVTFTYGYDSMGRPVSLTDGSALSEPLSPGPVNWVQDVQYDYAGRMTSMQYFAGSSPYYPGDWAPTYITETKSYNVNGQLSSLNWSGPCCGVNWGGIQYNYSTTHNNGQITQAVDSLSGETITYQYDSLKRLTSASSTASWTQTYQYDGFGNLTGKTLNGTTTPISVNAATNRLTSASYDLNGNMTSGLGASFGYDEANRMASAYEVSGGTETYFYAPDNKRVYRQLANGENEFILYGAMGEELGAYWLFNTQSQTYPWAWQVTFDLQGSKIWFAGKLIQDVQGPVIQDRLGTNRIMGARFMPFGDEITSTSNDREKFATYTRDSYTGLDYANQRYFASTYGRFNTPDRKLGSAHIGNPGSWNRYAYVLGDPINRNDPRGLDTEETCGGTDDGGAASDDCGAGGVMVSSDEYDANPDPPMASVTGTGCVQNGFTYTGGADGTCDLPLYGPYVPGLQQVGQNMAGFNSLLGAFAGGSAGIGFAGGLAAGYLGSTLPSLGLAGAAAASPQGQEAGDAVIDVGTTVWRTFGGSSPGMGNYWATVNPATVPGYANLAGLPPVSIDAGGVVTGNTGQFLVQGFLNDITGVTTSIAPGIGSNLGGLQQVVTQNPCQVTAICVSGLNPALVGRP